MLKKKSLKTDFPRSFNMTSLYPHNKIPSQQNLSDLSVQLNSLLTTLITTNFLKLWQSLAISAELFLVLLVDLSDFGSYWQHLNTKENGEGGIRTLDRSYLL